MDYWHECAHTYHGKQIDVNLSRRSLECYEVIKWNQIRVKDCSFFRHTEIKALFFYLIDIFYLSGWFSLHSIKVVHYLLLLFPIKEVFLLFIDQQINLYKIMCHMWYFLCFIGWFINRTQPTPFFLPGLFIR